ncbi:phospholipase A(1) LCAT3 isoform X2 [Amborella trichopoda]|uniref:Phospholipase A(1) LCAT3 n=1 Tax=Amborella trichopoda TaxID=13333 RepID=U5D3D9_AMBTC|nr:phospholipase A(1) LCAT3 isoform X2 [Amborella trichopoda]ERN20096.1 hypothetical protein AMTR_s00066p00036210 [Amborella trichopoda]|eukprot:XP_006858629.1 phospholipase A(1) LCAT3 isoform X2 [Amborella trichopoda]
MGGRRGRCFPCLFHGRRRSRRRIRRTSPLNEEEEKRSPVLLVSGIGGSILNARKKQKNKSGGDAPAIRVWVRFFLASLEFKKYVWSIFNPKTGYTESLDPDIEVIVPDDDYGLYAIDILDPTWLVRCLHLTDVYHFHDMIDMLLESGYEKGTTLFGYGYDFRQSNRIKKIVDGLREKLVTAYKASGGKKVNIISHSMGGLVVLAFLSLHRDVFEMYVNSWICIACPFQGAPGCINDSLLTGLQFVYGLKSFLFVSRWTMHQLLIECPSIYEMLPNPEFKWKQSPLINVWRKQSDGKGSTSVKMESFGPIETMHLFKEALQDNELEYDGKRVPVPFNFSILKWAIETRRIWKSALLPESVRFYNIFGTSYDTPFDVCYGSETSPIGNLSEICQSEPGYSWVDGDGTVPTESAKADGFSAAERVGISDTHRGLLSNETLFQHLKQWLEIN